MKSFLIGSLPHTEVDKAIDYSFSFSIPTIPSLANVDHNELMVEQAKRNSFFFVSQDKFFERLKTSYKWQACGPLTLKHSWKELDLTAYSTKLIAAQERYNGLSSDDSIFFLDEPILGYREDEVHVFKDFLEVLKKSSAFENTFFGVHICSKVSFHVLEDLEVDLISIDPALYDSQELRNLQSFFGKKLVYSPVSSKGDIIEYPYIDEVYVSCSCGQALASDGELLKIKEVLTSLQDRQD